MLSLSKQLEETAGTADDPRLMEEGILVVAVWALTSNEASYARCQIETALPSDA